jgi:hypothetical protein
MLVFAVLPYLHDAFMELHILAYFTIISLALASSLSIYNVTIMFLKSKRKTDIKEDRKNIGVKDIWKRSRHITKALFVLVCFYAAAVVYMLLWRIGIAGNVFPLIDVLWIVFSLISFTVAALIAAYHLSTWVLRRKRFTDHADNLELP